MPWLLSHLKTEKEAVNDAYDAEVHKELVKIREARSGFCVVEQVSSAQT